MPTKYTTSATWPTKKVEPEWVLTWQCAGENYSGAPRVDSPVSATYDARATRLPSSDKGDALWPALIG